MITINTDGGSRGNPGKAASAFIIKDNAGIVREKCGKYIGIETNNVAEYSAVVFSLEWCLQNTDKLEGGEIQFLLDSELVVRQITGQYKVKDEKMKRLKDKVFDLIKALNLAGVSKINFAHVLRSMNSEADRLVNETLDGV